MRAAFSLPEELVKQLRDLAARCAEPQSRIVAAAIILLLADVRGEPAPPEAELVRKKLLACFSTK